MPLLENHIYAVILSGGSGTRFWPKSRQTSPKQLCKIGDNDRTMIEITLQRLDDFIPEERRIIVTHRDQLAATKELVGEKAGIFLAEPEARNTANALAMAAMEIKKRYHGSENPIMVSLHADHIIEDVPAFQQAISKAIESAKEGFLTLMGLVPSHPVTGYGYIEEGEELNHGTYKVKSFREKPEYELAKSYVESKRFYWNAGIFIWRNDVLIDELNARLPVTVRTLEKVSEGKASFDEIKPDELEIAYNQLPKISIDNAVLEVSDRVALVKADIGWQDVGSWDALSECFSTDENGNFILGDAMVIDSENITVDTDSYFVAALGMKDTVIACSKGAILVCPTDRAQEVKKIVEQLKEKKRLELI